MKTSNLCRNLEYAFSLTSPPRTRCLYDHTRSLDRLVHHKRALSTSLHHSARPERLINDRRSDGDEERARAQDELDALADGSFQAAPEIEFDKFKPNAEPANRGAISSSRQQSEVLRSLRVLPASPSYFTAKPRFTDDFLYLQQLLRKYTLLPTVRPGEQPRTAWRDFDTYQRATSEPIRRSRYRELVDTLRRMNMIHPTLMPGEVQATLNHWARDIQPSSNKAAPIEIDEFGRAAAVGRRKSSSAKAWVVEGDGQALINGLPIHKVFARVHDRESVLWALKVTERLDKYNIFGMVHGGGTTGQAEALTLAISKALMAHEPILKKTLRIAGCVHRDPRRVERKKPGKLKARKMPAWVKR